MEGIIQGIYTREINLGAIWEFCQLKPTLWHLQLTFLLQTKYVHPLPRFPVLYNIIASARAPLVAQTAKRLPAVRETRVQFLGREDTLEKEMATHSSIFAWKIPQMEEPGRLQSMGSQRVRDDWPTSLSIASASSVSQISFSKSSVDEIPKVWILGQDFLLPQIHRSVHLWN